MAALVAAVPFDAGRAVQDPGARIGRRALAEALLTRVSAGDADRARRVGVDARGRVEAACAVRRSRARRRRSTSTALDWWDRMFGVDLIVSSLCLHHLNDAKKQYLYKAAAERLSPAARC